MLDDRHVVPRATLLLCLFSLLLAALLPAKVHSAGHSGETLAALEDSVLRQLNRIRAAHGLKPLRRDPGLTAAARQHTFEMLSDGYFEHESAGGEPFWKRIQRYYSRTQYGRWSVGENLAWGGSLLPATKAVELWMASPPHRQNILASSWREIGISAVYSATSTGAYGGSEVTIITTDFGARS